MNQGWQSDATDGLKGAWSLSLFPSLSLTIYLPTYLFSMYLSICRSIYLSIYLSFSFIWLPYLSIYLSIYLSLSLFHLSICLASPIVFLFLKLPPLPCAVLLVFSIWMLFHVFFIFLRRTPARIISYFFGTRFSNLFFCWYWQPTGSVVNKRALKLDREKQNYSWIWRSSSSLL